MQACHKTLKHSASLEREDNTRKRQQDRYTTTTEERRLANQGKDKNTYLCRLTTGARRDISTQRESQGKEECARSVSWGSRSYARRPQGTWEKGASESELLSELNERKSSSTRTAGRQATGTNTLGTSASTWLADQIK